MPKPSTAADRIRSEHPEIWHAFSNLAQACHNAGPPDEKTRRLVKLALAVGSGSEGATHSAVRHANEAGVTTKEMEHVVLLSITSIGLPGAGRALAWILEKRHAPLHKLRVLEPKRTPDLHVKLGEPLSPHNQLFTDPEMHCEYALSAASACVDLVAEVSRSRG